MTADLQNLSIAVKAVALKKRGSFSDTQNPKTVC